MLASTGIWHFQSVFISYHQIEKLFSLRQCIDCYCCCFSAVSEGFVSPTLSLLDATTVFVEWQAPLRPNGQLLSYQLSVSEGTSPVVTTPQGLSTTATLTDLLPFTLYLVSVSVTNSVGTAVSPQSNITTGETGQILLDHNSVISLGLKNKQSIHSAF